MKRKTGAYLVVGEDLSTVPTHKLPSVVGFGQKSIVYVHYITTYRHCQYLADLYPGQKPKLLTKH